MTSNLSLNNLEKIMNKNIYIDKTRFEKKEALLKTIERYTELPLTIAALLMVPLLVGHFFWNLTENTKNIFLVLDIFIWAIFAADFSIKLAVAPKKISYIRNHWLDIMVIALPWFRPLRIIRVIVFAARSYQGVKRIARPDFLLIYAIALIIFSATTVTTIEQSNQTNLSSFSNALWWSFATITTVGYGDMTPSTELGRGVGYVLMLGGIGIFGAITANLASVFVKQPENNDDAINELTKEIKSLRNELSTVQSGK